MTEKIENALERLKVWEARLKNMRGPIWCGADTEALVAIKAALEDYEKVKAEVERLTPYEETYKHYERENTELRAELEKQRPLIEAVMRARLVKFSDSDVGGYEPHVQRILRVALKLREGEGR